MPIYEYRCANGHTFEVMQRMTDGPATECQVCGAEVARVFRPPAVHFKGSGFYNTDYGTRKRAREQKESSSSDGSKSAETKSSEGSSSSSSSNSSSGSEKKPAAKDAA